jgi:ribosomal protein L37AE/L43A
MTERDRHACLAEKQCRGAKVVDGERQPAITEQPDTLCPACHKAITDAVHQLPKDWGALRAALGDRPITDGPKISSTPTPPMPISVRKDALMNDIAETAIRAAEIVADALNTDPPARRPPADAKPGSLACRTFEDTRAHQLGALIAAVRMVEPNLNLLAGAELSDHVIWDQRGEHHEITSLSGIDVALDLADLHHQARAELGKTRLRHRYAMPCPHCGGRVGRDDGQTIVDCDKCKSSWTEREYKFLAGLIVDERQDMEITKYLLAEAYSRLDDVHKRLYLLTTVERHTLELPGAGVIVAEAMQQAIAGHLPPVQRAIATDKKTTELRQVDEDVWEWGDRPTPYKPPKPKRKRQRVTHATAPPKPIHPASRSLLVDVDEDAALRGQIQ